MSLKGKATLLSLRHTARLQLVKVEAAAVHVTCMQRMASQPRAQADSCNLTGVMQCTWLQDASATDNLLELHN